MISSVSANTDYTTWTLQMCQQNYRAHEDTYPMITYIHSDWTVLSLLHVQDSKYEAGNMNVWYSLYDWSINIAVTASVSCYVSLIIREEKLHYFYIHHFKNYSSVEVQTTKSCTWFPNHENIFHVITQFHIRDFLVLKHITQNLRGIWEKDVNNSRQSRLLQLFCATITQVRHKISWEVPQAK